MGGAKGWHVTEVFDNGGRTFDRYSIHFEYGDGEEHGYLFVGPTGNVPNGVCMWSDTAGDGEEIDFDSLPDPVKRAALAEEGAAHA